MKLGSSFQRRFWQITAFTVHLCFTTTTVAWANPAFGASSSFQAINPLANTVKQLNIPERLGRIDEFFLPERLPSGSPFVVYLQDAHSNLGAQRNIGALARELGAKLKIDTLLVEGGAGAVDLSELRGFPEQKAKEKATDFWLKEAVLTGIEQQAIVSKHEFQFFGIENQELYDVGGKYFLETKEKTEAFVSNLQPLIQKNAANREKVFNKDLKRFDNFVATFEATENIVTLVSFLANEARNLHINRWKYREIEKLIDLILLEMQGGNAERIFEIQKTLDSAELFEQLDALKRDIKEAFFETDEERALEAEREVLNLIRNLASLSATPQEFDRYIQLNELISKYIAETKLDTAVLASAEAFYHSAYERDKKMFTNVKKILEREDVKRAIVVTGGFHAPGITQKFRDHEIPFVLITPQISDENNSRNYYARIAGQRADFEAFSDAMLSEAKGVSASEILRSTQNDKDFYAAPLAVADRAEVQTILDSFSLRSAKHVIARPQQPNLRAEAIKRVQNHLISSLAFGLLVMTSRGIFATRTELRANAVIPSKAKDLARSFVAPSGLLRMTSGRQAEGSLRAEARKSFIQGFTPTKFLLHPALRPLAGEAISFGQPLENETVGWREGGVEWRNFDPETHAYRMPLAKLMHRFANWDETEPDMILQPVTSTHLIILDRKSPKHGNVISISLQSKTVKKIIENDRNVFVEFQRRRKNEKVIRVYARDARGRPDILIWNGTYNEVDEKLERTANFKPERLAKGERYRVQIEAWRLGYVDFEARPERGAIETPEPAGQIPVSENPKVLDWIHNWWKRIRSVKTETETVPITRQTKAYGAAGPETNWRLRLANVAFFDVREAKRGTGNIAWDDLEAKMTELAGPNVNVHLIRNWLSRHSHLPGLMDLNRRMSLTTSDVRGEVRNTKSEADASHRNPFSHPGSQMSAGRYLGGVQLVEDAKQRGDAGERALWRAIEILENETQPDLHPYALHVLRLFPDQQRVRQIITYKVDETEKQIVPGNWSRMGRYVEKNNPSRFSKYLATAAGTEQSTIGTRGETLETRVLTKMFREYYIRILGHRVQMGDPAAKREIEAMRQAVHVMSKQAEEKAKEVGETYVQIHRVGTLYPGRSPYKTMMALLDHPLLVDVKLVAYVDGVSDRASITRALSGHMRYGRRWGALELLIPYLIKHHPEIIQSMREACAEHFPRMVILEWVRSVLGYGGEERLQIDVDRETNYLTKTVLPTLVLHEGEFRLRYQEKGSENAMRNKIENPSESKKKVDDLLNDSRDNWLSSLVEIQQAARWLLAEPLTDQPITVDIRQDKVAESNPIRAGQYVYPGSNGSARRPYDPDTDRNLWAAWRIDLRQMRSTTVRRALHHEDGMLAVHSRSGKLPSSLSLTKSIGLGKGTIHKRRLIQALTYQLRRRNLLEKGVEGRQVYQNLREAAQTRSPVETIFSEEWTPNRPGADFATFQVAERETDQVEILHLTISDLQAFRKLIETTQEVFIPWIEFRSTTKGIQVFIPIVDELGHESEYIFTIRLDSNGDVENCTELTGGALPIGTILRLQGKALPLPRKYTNVVVGQRESSAEFFLRAIGKHPSEVNFYETLIGTNGSPVIEALESYGARRSLGFLRVGPDNHLERAQDHDPVASAVADLEEAVRQSTNTQGGENVEAKRTLVEFLAPNHPILFSLMSADQLASTLDGLIINIELSLHSNPALFFGPARQFADIVEYVDPARWISHSQRAHRAFERVTSSYHAMFGLQPQEKKAAAQLSERFAALDEGKKLERGVTVDDEQAALVRPDYSHESPAPKEKLLERFQNTQEFREEIVRLMYEVLSVLTSDFSGALTHAKTTNLNKFLRARQTEIETLLLMAIGDTDAARGILFDVLNRWHVYMLGGGAENLLTQLQRQVKAPATETKQGNNDETNMPRDLKAIRNSVNSIRLPRAHTHYRIGGSGILTPLVIVVYELQSHDATNPNVLEEHYDYITELIQERKPGKVQADVHIYEVVGNHVEFSQFVGMLEGGIQSIDFLLSSQRNFDVLTAKTNGLFTNFSGVSAKNLSSITNRDWHAFFWHKHQGNMVEARAVPNIQIGTPRTTTERDDAVVKGSQTAHVKSARAEVRRNMVYFDTLAPQAEEILRAEVRKNVPSGKKLVGLDEEEAFFQFGIEYAEPRRSEKQIIEEREDLLFGSASKDGWQLAPHQARLLNGIRPERLRARREVLETLFRASRPDITEQFDPTAYPELLALELTGDQLASARSRLIKDGFGAALQSLFPNDVEPSTDDYVEIVDDPIALILWKEFDAELERAKNARRARKRKGVREREKAAAPRNNVIDSQNRVSKFERTSKWDKFRELLLAYLTAPAVETTWYRKRLQGGRVTIPPHVIHHGTSTGSLHLISIDKKGYGIKKAFLKRKDAIFELETMLVKLPDGSEQARFQIYEVGTTSPLFDGFWTGEKFQDEDGRYTSARYREWLWNSGLTPSKTRPFGRTIQIYNMKRKEEKRKGRAYVYGKIILFDLVLTDDTESGETERKVIGLRLDERIWKEGPRSGQKVSVFPALAPDGRKAVTVHLPNGSPVGRATWSDAKKTFDVFEGPAFLDSALVPQRQALAEWLNHPLDERDFEGEFVASETDLKDGTQGIRLNLYKKRNSRAHAFMQEGFLPGEKVIVRGIGIRGVRRIEINLPEVWDVETKKISRPAQKIVRYFINGAFLTEREYLVHVFSQWQDAAPKPLETTMDRLGRIHLIGMYSAPNVYVNVGARRAEDTVRGRRAFLTFCFEKIEGIKRKVVRIYGFHSRWDRKMRPIEMLWEGFYDEKNNIMVKLKSSKVRKLHGPKRNEIQLYAWGHGFCERPKTSITRKETADDILDTLDNKPKTLNELVAYLEGEGYDADFAALVFEALKQKNKSFSGHIVHVGGERYGRAHPVEIRKLGNRRKMLFRGQPFELSDERVLVGEPAWAVFEDTKLLKIIQEDGEEIQTRRAWTFPGSVLAESAVQAISHPGDSFVAGNLRANRGKDPTIVRFTRPNGLFTIPILEGERLSLLSYEGNLLRIDWFSPEDEVHQPYELIDRNGARHIKLRVGVTPVRTAEAKTLDGFTRDDIKIEFIKSLGLYLDETPSPPGTLLSTIFPDVETKNARTQVEGLFKDNGRKLTFLRNKLREDHPWIPKIGNFPHEFYASFIWALDLVEVFQNRLTDLKERWGASHAQVPKQLGWSSQGVKTLEATLRDLEKKKGNWERELKAQIVQSVVRFREREQELAKQEATHGNSKPNASFEIPIDLSTPDSPQLVHGDGEIGLPAGVIGQPDIKPQVHYADYTLMRTNNRLWRVLEDFLLEAQIDRPWLPRNLTRYATVLRQLAQALEVSDKVNATALKRKLPDTSTTRQLFDVVWKESEQRDRKSFKRDVVKHIRELADQLTLESDQMIAEDADEQGGVVTGEVDEESGGEALIGEREPVVFNSHSVIVEVKRLFMYFSPQTIVVQINDTQKVYDGAPLSDLVDTKPSVRFDNLIREMLLTQQAPGFFDYYARIDLLHNRVEVVAKPRAEVRKRESIEEMLANASDSVRQYLSPFVRLMGAILYDMTVAYGEISIKPASLFADAVLVATTDQKVFESEGSKFVGELHGYYLNTYSASSMIRALGSQAGFRVVVPAMDFLLTYKLRNDAQFQKKKPAGKATAPKTVGRRGQSLRVDSSSRSDDGSARTAILEYLMTHAQGKFITAGQIAKSVSSLQSIVDEREPVSASDVLDAVLKIKKKKPHFYEVVHIQRKNADTHLIALTSAAVKSKYDNLIEWLKKTLPRITLSNSDDKTELRSAIGLVMDDIKFLTQFVGDGSRSDAIKTLKLMLTNETQNGFFAPSGPFGDQGETAYDVAEELLYQLEHKNSIDYFLPSAYSIKVVVVRRQAGGSVSRKPQGVRESFETKLNRRYTSHVASEGPDFLISVEPVINVVGTNGLREALLQGGIGPIFVGTANEQSLTQYNQAVESALEKNPSALIISSFFSQGRVLPDAILDKVIENAKMEARIKSRLEVRTGNQTIFQANLSARARTLLTSFLPEQAEFPRDFGYAGRTSQRLLDTAPLPTSLEGRAPSVVTDSLSVEVELATPAVAPKIEVGGGNWVAVPFEALLGEAGAANRKTIRAILRRAADPKFKIAILAPEFPNDLFAERAVAEALGLSPEDVFTHRSIKLYGPQRLLGDQTVVRKISVANSQQLLINQIHIDVERMVAIGSEEDLTRLQHGRLSKKLVKLLDQGGALEAAVKLLRTGGKLWQRIAAPRDFFTPSELTAHFSRDRLITERLSAAA